jgi:hypothetical protein
VAIRALFIGGGGSSALIFPSVQLFSVLRPPKRCFPTPAPIIFPFRFRARHWLWIRLSVLGLEAAAGQTITRMTDEEQISFLRLYRRQSGLGRDDLGSGLRPGRAYVRLFFVVVADPVAERLSIAKLSRSATQCVHRV